MGCLEISRGGGEGGEEEERGERGPGWLGIEEKDAAQFIGQGTWIFRDKQRRREERG